MPQSEKHHVVYAATTAEQWVQRSAAAQNISCPPCCCGLQKQHNRTCSPLPPCSRRLESRTCSRQEYITQRVRSLAHRQQGAEQCVGRRRIPGTRRCKTLCSLTLLTLRDQCCWTPTGGRPGAPSGIAPGQGALRRAMIDLHGKVMLLAHLGTARQPCRLAVHSRWCDCQHAVEQLYLGVPPAGQCSVSGADAANTAAAAVTTAAAAAAAAAIALCCEHACSLCTQRAGRPQTAARCQKRLRACPLCTAGSACFAQQLG